ncbi:MAG TPA: hypothetical protein VJG64_01650 [Candidatus Paceibacterota bacterium]
MPTLRSVFEYLLDALVPPRARSARTKARTIVDIPLSPTEYTLLGERITTLMDYRQSEVGDLIRTLKYDGSSHAARLAAEVLAEYLREEIASLKLFSTRPIFLIPIPLHKSRSRERGFNQVALILNALPQEFRDGRIATLSPALVRTRATAPQTRLPRPERIKNVAGAFALVDNTLIKRAHVFLIDDVTTTGATLVNAGKVLKASGASLSLLALARA